MITSHYLSTYFLLNTGVGVYTTGDTDLLYFHVAMLLGAIALSFFIRGEKNRITKHMLRRWSGLLYTISILGLVWSALRDQGVVILSSHVIIIAIYLAAAIWTAVNIWYMATDYQVLSEAHRKEEIRQRYLPKK